MFSSRFFPLSALAALLPLVASNRNSTCQSFGVDFVDEESYFINTESQDPFTCVSTFKGCNPSKAEVIIVNPAGDEQFCTQVDTASNDTPQLSTCPILKNQMVSGDWMVLVLGNNGDGEPFAYERDLYLDCGPQETITITPTITFFITTTPTVTSVSAFFITSTLEPTATFTVPSATRVKTITPEPIITTSTLIYTKTRTSWKKEFSITTRTVIASCTLPPNPGQPDKPCTYQPTLIHPAALATPTVLPRFNRKADRVVDVKYAGSRIEAAKLRHEQKVNAAAPLQERAPDTLTITSTAPIPINSTATITAAPVTEFFFSTTTSTLQLPPVTIYSGYVNSTTTLPTVTKTRFNIEHTIAFSTSTITATLTRVLTVIPSASITACESRGGRIDSGRV